MQRATVQKLRPSSEGCSQPVVGLQRESASEQRGANISSLSCPLISCQALPTKGAPSEASRQSPLLGQEPGTKARGTDPEQQMEDRQQRVFRECG